MLPLFLLLQVQSPSGPPAEAARAPTVPVPRFEQDVEVDGRLSESVWSQAARLSGFHQFEPVDGRPAEEETLVLVWYSAHAIYFGVMAHDRAPASIRATVADRDHLDSDDRITIYLDTFNDRRRAFFFTVNPLGAQQDGVRTEGTENAGSIVGGTIDRNPDFLFASKGQLTPRGYMLEIRIPFKSLRYPATREQRWGINIVRDIPRTGHQDTWTDTRRASASFLAQSGTLEGLHDLSRGVVTELQPVFTATSEGARQVTGDFERTGLDPSFGGNARLGLTNLSLDLTANPDFSQVESDASLVTVNERFALFFPEKRPFFLDGIELFSTPNQLIYTRQIIDPIGGGKVTGKFGRYGIAHLTAVDETLGDDAVFNLTRLRRDLGANSLAGFTFTDRRQGGDYNTVASGDARLVFGRLYFVQGQVAGSWTRTGDMTARAPLWRLELDRTGRAWGFNYQLNGIGEDFVARSGFVPRNNVVRASGFNRFSLYGRRGAALENFTTFFGPTRLWSYGGFGTDGPIEGGESIDLRFQFRGGWLVQGSFARNFVAFDPRMYGAYQVDRGNGILDPFVPPQEVSGLFGESIQLSTPTFQTFNAIVRVTNAQVPIFAEAGEGREFRVTSTLALRPSDKLRVEARNVLSRITRDRDGREFAQTLIPRLKVEFQPNRALFFRFVGEYRSTRQAALADPRTGEPLLVRGAPAAASESGTAQLDWLASFEPTPGTVVFVGYGLTLGARRALELGDLERTGDLLFVKLAYLIRR